MRVTMGSLSDLKRKWLADLGAIVAAGKSAPVPVAKVEGIKLDGLSADAKGESDATPAAAPLAAFGPRRSSFVPDLAVVGATQRELAIGGNLSIELKVRNWPKRPKDTELDWSFRASGPAVDFEFDKLVGEGLLKVTGQAAGKGVVKAEVKVVGGRTVRFPDLVFTVTPTAKKPASWVPRLELPRTVNHELAVGEKVPLQLVVGNWDQRPAGTTLDWSASVAGEAIDIELAHRGGEATVTIAALDVGQGKVKAEVKVLGGGSYTFADTPFTVIRDSDPNRSVDKGGQADSTNLEQDMRNVLQDWHAAAHAGINQFVAAELSKRIDKLESGSARSFLFALVGNVVWAAACFTTGGAAFAISLTGIAIGAVPAVPSESESFIPAVQKAMGDHIDGIFDQLDKSLRNKARLLVERFPGITRFHAMNEFVGQSFKAPFISLNPKHTTIPTLAKTAVRDHYQQIATKHLDEAIRADEADKAAKKAAKDWEKLQRDSRRRPGEV